MSRVQKRRLRKASRSTKSITSFRRTIRAATRGLLTGDFDLFDFLNVMNSAIDRGYEQAWREGARSCGIRPDERTPQEMSELASLISVAKSRTFALGEFVQEAETFSDVSNRLDVWANRYNEVKSKAQAMACSDQKFEWMIGDADHCTTCKKLNGRVMRGSRWQQLDVHPQDTRPGKLECNGFNCKCRLEPTNKWATPGRLPGLP